MRNSSGQFVKGHEGYGKGQSKWGFCICTCGARFKVYKKETGLQRFCSISCSLIGTQRSVGHKVSVAARMLMSRTWIKKGTVPWNKGKKTGIAPWLGKKMPMISREKHWNWRGGITKPNEKARKVPEYKTWRGSCLRRDNYTCQLCGKRGGDLEVDHIKPFAAYVDLRYEVSNGRTLCKPCHVSTETFGYSAMKYQNI